MATHVIRRFGNYEREFSRLLDQTKIEGENPLSKKIEEEKGLQFFYMQSHQEFLAVGVQEREGPSGVKLLLRAPVLLISERHVDRKGYLQDPHIGDESAMHLLVDMIIANPERRDVLGGLLVELKKG